MNQTSEHQMRKLRSVSAYKNVNKLSQLHRFNGNRSLSEANTRVLNKNPDGFGTDMRTINQFAVKMQTRDQLPELWFPRAFTSSQYECENSEFHNNPKKLELIGHFLIRILIIFSRHKNSSAFMAVIYGWDLNIFVCWLSHFFNGIIKCEWVSTWFGVEQRRQQQPHPIKYVVCCRKIFVNIVINSHNK